MEPLEERLRKAEEAMAPPARALSTEAALELARALKARGHSDRAIGRYFGTSAMTVRRRLDPDKYQAQRARWAVNLERARKKKRQLIRREEKKVRRIEAERLVRASPLGILSNLLGTGAGGAGSPNVGGVPDSAALQAFQAQLIPALEARAAVGDAKAAALLAKLRAQG